MPEISVIVVNWNGKCFLEDCLGALRRQTFRDFETILVDNGSTDGSVEYIRNGFREVQLFALTENLGFTGGNIVGYERATGDLIALLNNDTEAHPAWLEEIHKASKAHPDAGSFASRMMYFDDRTRIENCGFDVDMSGTSVDIGRNEPDSPEWHVPRKVFGACGGAAVYRRIMLERIGFLDPDFFMLYEDVDLSFRAQLFGYDCVYIPQALVYHHYRSTIGKQPDLQVFYGQRNIDWVYLKNLPAALLLRSAPRRLLYEIGAAFYFLKTGSARTFCRAKLDVLGHLSTVLKKRRAIQKRATPSSSRLRAIMCGSVFASKWKRFRSTGKAAPSSGRALPTTIG
jgi:GT2 family glycosyltransferase